MRQINSKLWSSLTPLGSLLLVACVPPPSSITVYTTVGAEASTSSTPTPSNTRTKSCIKYKLPNLPDLSDLAENDHRGVVDRLSAHIATLRHDIKRLTDQTGCQM